MTTKTKATPAAQEIRVTDALGAIAVRLAAWTQEADAHGLIYVARSERRAEHLAGLLRGVAPGLETLVFPPWDCLPYDRAAPSRSVMGRRAAALRALAQPSDAPRLVITSPDSLLQRVPPRRIWAEAVCVLRHGDALDLPNLTAFLRRAGYVLDERVDEAGEAALRGGVIDVFPADSDVPVRIDHVDGRIDEIRRYDPITQRTLEAVETFEIEPASELVVEADGPEEDRAPGLEHWLPDYYPDLETLFDYLPKARLVLAPKAESRLATALEQIADAYENRSSLRSDRPRPAPARLYLEPDELSTRIAERAPTRLSVDPEATPAPSFATEKSPAAACAAYVSEQLAKGRRVVLAAAADHDARIFAQRVAKPLNRVPEAAAGWDSVRSAPADAMLAMRLDLDAGFVDEAANAVVIAAADLLGSRAASADDGAGAPSLPFGEIGLCAGDAVIHLDHGLAELQGLETIAAPGAEPCDMLRLDYADDATLMAPVDEFDRIWRYGSEADVVTRDRLDGKAWATRRKKVEAEIRETAKRLVEMAQARASLIAPVLKPPQAEYERFVRRFPFAETRDQTRAVSDVLDDLASGRPMDRLVCGDVGFGKTEIALRAVAACVLAGKQAAIVAPTTVLARQHMETFTRRFAGFGIEIAQLSRLVKPAEAKRVKAGLADGSIRLVIATHALAAKGVRFQDLGLLAIDEEQRFGVRHKARLRDLGSAAHVLTLTATPIPRTLQAAMAGLQEISIIATPPARRQPIRTFLTPYDGATVRHALVRERLRGGQSFVVCPRIEDIAPMADRLRGLVPELSVRIAHGGMAPAELDEVMVRFADGDGDVLLATNIIESGLDVPRANTMLIWRADRFGLAQLHQLRGRVGRGARRGAAYLLTEPENSLSPATEKRLRTLEALDRLGAGFAISARDLDLRGAGDLLGEEQAGHLKLIGLGLYQHLLERALSAARGEKVDEDWTPDINLGAGGRIPEAYVPEPEVRIELYAQIARLHGKDEIDALAEEIEDRFGTPPDEVRSLLARMRLRGLCRAVGVATLNAGPRAIALGFRRKAEKRPAVRKALAESDGSLAWKDRRLVWRRESETIEGRERLAVELLTMLA